MLWGDNPHFVWMKVDARDTAHLCLQVHTNASSLIEGQFHPLPVFARLESTLALESGIRQVLHTVTRKHKRLFIILAQYQLLRMNE